MIISTLEQRKRYRAIWPKIKISNIWIDQRNVWLPLYDEVFELVKKNSVSKLRYISGPRECEKSAERLWSNIHDDLAHMADKIIDAGDKLPEHLSYTWSIGYARGFNFNDVPEIYRGEPHVVCVADTRDRGIVLIDQMRDVLWAPSVSKKPEHNDFVYSITI